MQTFGKGITAPLRGLWNHVLAARLSGTEYQNWCFFSPREQLFMALIVPLWEISAWILVSDSGSVLFLWSPTNGIFIFGKSIRLLRALQLFIPVAQHSHCITYITFIARTDAWRVSTCMCTGHRVYILIREPVLVSRPWWRHQMEIFSALLTICAGNSPIPCEFPTQRPVTRSFDVYFDLHPNKRLSKHSWGWWFETQSHPLWRHRNEAKRGCVRSHYSASMGTREPQGLMMMM